MTVWRYLGILFGVCCVWSASMAQKPFRVMFYNVENLFDCRDDSLKDDDEFLPGTGKRWTHYRYWRKLNALSKVVAAVGEEHLPDLIGLCEVENDSVVFDLACRSAMRTLGYRYVVTHSPDERGIDVALLYQPGCFRLLGTREVVVPSLQEGFRPTRNLLYVKGRVLSGDTLHVVVCHFPSRLGKTLVARRHRLLAAHVLRGVVDSVHADSPKARMIVMGDFNAGGKDEIFEEAFPAEYHEPAWETKPEGIGGSYRYRGIWETIDHIWVSPALMDVRNRLHTSDGKFRVAAFPFMCEPDKTYGGVRPFRTYQGPLYKGGYSDHFPVTVDFIWRFPDE